MRGEVKLFDIVKGKEKMDLGAPELLLILVIIILLFGVGRIGKVAGELGSGIRAFREGLQGDKTAPVATSVKEETTVTPINQADKTS
jgi:sec-independent protein translocase protein TatA